MPIWLMQIEATLIMIIFIAMIITTLITTGITIMTTAPSSLLNCRQGQRCFGGDYGAASAFLSKAWVGIQL